MTEDQPLSVPYGVSLDAVEIGRESGIESTLIALYQQMRQPAVAYVSQIVGSVEDAEDLLQIAFVRLCEQLTRRLEVRNARGWIYRVVHNLAIDHIRRVRTADAALPALELAVASRAAPSIETVVIRRQQIAHALGRLNERERHCLMLRAEGLRYQEIGEVLGISAKAVSVYLARGLKKFAPAEERRP